MNALLKGKEEGGGEGSRTSENWTSTLINDAFKNATKNFLPKFAYKFLVSSKISFAAKLCLHFSKALMFDRCFI